MVSRKRPAGCGSNRHDMRTQSIKRASITRGIPPGPALPAWLYLLPDPRDASILVLGHDGQAADGLAALTSRCRVAPVLAADEAAPKRNMDGPFRLSYRDASFDVVLLSSESAVSRNRRLVSEVRRVLKPSGVLLITFGSARAGRLAAIARLIGRRPLTASGYQQLLRRCGFPETRWYVALPSASRAEVIFPAVDRPLISRILQDRRLECQNAWARIRLILMGLVLRRRLLAPLGPEGWLVAR